MFIVLYFTRYENRLIFRNLETFGIQNVLKDYS